MKRSSLNREFFRFLAPSISAMWVFSIYTMVDGMFVGRGVGPVALAAVNISMPFINLIFGISLLLSIGASTIIAMSMGKGEMERASELFTMGKALLWILGISIAAISMKNLDSIAIFLGADNATISHVKDYLGIIALFSPFFMVAYYLEVLVKTDGFPRYAIVFVGFAALMNIILDYVFIMRLGWGIRGAAWATGLSQFMSCMGFMIHFVMGSSNLKLVRFKLEPGVLAQMFSIGTPEAITEFSTGITVFIFNLSIMKYIGEEGVAAFGVMMYINTLVIMSMIGINQAMQPLVSYFYGREDYSSIMKIVKLSLKSVVVASILFTGASQIFSRQLVGLFISPHDSRIYTMSQEALRLFSLSFLICGFNIMISGYFTAVKKVGKALAISVLRGFVLVGVFAAVLPHFMGKTGIWTSLFASETAALAVSATLLAGSKRRLESLVVFEKNAGAA